MVQSLAPPQSQSVRVSMPRMLLKFSSSSTTIVPSLFEIVFNELFTPFFDFRFLLVLACEVMKIPEDYVICLFKFLKLMPVLPWKRKPS
jgi:hypothetical protein